MLFVKLRLDVRWWRSFRNRNVFGRWSRFLRWWHIEGCLNCRRRDIGDIDRRRFFVKGDRHGDTMYGQGSADGGKDLPFGSRFIEKRASH